MFKDVVDVLGLGLARSMVGLIRILPERLGLVVAQVPVFAIRILMPRSDAVGMRNLALVFPEKTVTEHRKILNACYLNFSRSLLAFAKFGELSSERAKQMLPYDAELKHLELIRQKNTNTGLLICTGHFGVFELNVQLHALLNQPTSILARGFGLRRLDSWWNKERARFGNEIFFRKGGYRDIEKRLKSGQDVSVLIDQNVKINHAIFVDFFGIPAATTKAVALAALRTRAPIIFLVAARLGPDRYRPILKEIHYSVDDTRPLEEKIVAIMNQVHKALEDAIREYPEQWFWIHRRFKTRPNGQPETMYD